MLELVQRQLEDLYHLEPAPSVRDFLITEAARAKLGLARHANEQLFLRPPTAEARSPSEQALELGLFLDEKALAKLDAHDPREHLGSHNLSEWCLVIEGVSHFLLVVDRFTADRSVSALELELQAEVDKYVASYLFGRGPSEADLRSHLFDDVRFADDLSPEESERYQVACHRARRYTKRLGERFIRKSQVPAMVYELRQFYRADLSGKLERIASP